MPEIKLKHVVSFSSEDKVYKAENLLKPEAYRKWKCATPGEKNASIILQFEKATKIHSIDIGNESSAFVEVLVGRSSDNLNDYQVLLVASSFMSPIESRNESHCNRVRMFGPEKLAQNLKEEKWDCVQVVCTQPFNKNITYGLSFIKFHSPPEKVVEQCTESEAKITTSKLGAFKIKYDDGDEEDLPPIGSWFEKKSQNSETPPAKPKKEVPSYAAAVLDMNSSPRTSQNPIKRKHDNTDVDDDKPAKKEPSALHVNKDKIGYTNILGPKKTDESNSSKNQKFGPGDIFGLNSNLQSPSSSNKIKNKPIPKKAEVATIQGKEKTGTADKKTPFRQIMKGVVFVISGFVNPLRSEIRDKAIEMGAKYKGDWDKSCTHLICAFVNTPKYIQVQGQGGKIVTKDWIIECHKKRSLLPWRKYMLGRYARDSSESSESEEEVQAIPKTKTKSPLLNGSSKPTDSKNILPGKGNVGVSKNTAYLNKNNVDSNVVELDDNSETEDEEALKDYMANTDVESDSGGDTEDEIRKAEIRIKQEAMKKKKETFSDDEDSDSLLQTKPDTSDLPLPELPNLFKSRHFFLYGNFSSSKEHDLHRYITAYNGKIAYYMNADVKYVISDSKWDRNFEEALSENEDLIFVKPDWIFKCHEAGKLVPYQPFIIIPF